MEVLIETFHIDVKLLLAQMINFGIVFSVLYFFAIKPIIEKMQDREKIISKSVEDAKSIEEKLYQTETDYLKKIADAKKEANNIIEQAKKESEVKKDEMIKKAKDEIGQIIAQEKDKIRTEKEKTLLEIKKEISDLVILSLEKVLEKKVDSKSDKEIIKKIIE